jgi:hypothetical protein
VETVGFKPMSSIVETSPPWMALDRRLELVSIKLEPGSVVQLDHDDPGSSVSTTIGSRLAFV